MVIRQTQRHKNQEHIPESYTDVVHKQVLMIENTMTNGPSSNLFLKGFREIAHRKYQGKHSKFCEHQRLKPNLNCFMDLLKRRNIQ